MALLEDRPVSWHFGSVVVDTASFRVSVDGVPRDLEPKSFRLLQFLLENRARAVTKEEIFQAVWAGTVVSDNALTRSIAQIRKAIGDDPRQPRYIETIATVGYRFIAQVEVLAEPLPITTRRRPKRIPVAGVAALVLVAATAGFWLRSSTPTAEKPVPFVPVQFSSSAALDLGASFSPDGNLIAYASDKSGAFEIYVKSFDTGARQLQITNDGNHNLYPAFSPDGRWIAFASTRRPGIFRVPAIGGPVQRLADFGVQPQWSPDGQTIVFRSTGAASLSTTDYYWWATSHLWTVSSGGGPPKQITGVNGQPPGGQSFPSFSPNGGEIRFLNHHRREASIWTYRVKDGQFTKRFASTQFPYSDATFAPDGTRMWFVDWRLNGNIGIWQLALNPATLTPVGDPEPLYPSSFAVPFDLSLSSDGKRMAFTGALSHSAILSKGLSGNRDEPVTLTQDTTYRYALLRSSPDGTRVVYTSFPRNAQSSIWVVGAGGGPATPVGGLGRNHPSLTPDNQVVFFVDRGGGKVRLMSQSLIDGASRELGELPRGTTHVMCSPDCSLVTFQNELDERTTAYIQDTAAGSRRVLVPGGQAVGYPWFSRDGKWITVERRDLSTGGSELSVLPAGGGGAQVVLRSDQPTFTGGWMPDNDGLLFAGFREGAWNLYAVSRATHKVERLTSYTSPRTYVRYPDWLAGDRVVYEFNETKGNIFVANLWPNAIRTGHQPAAMRATNGAAVRMIIHRESSLPDLWLGFRSPNDIRRGQ